MNVISSSTQHYSQASAHNQEHTGDEKQRMATFIAGGGALAFALLKRGWPGALIGAAGGYLLYRSMASTEIHDNDVLVGQTINKPPNEVYAFFRDPQHWPSFESALGSRNGSKSAGQPLMEITEEVPESTLRWRFHGEDAEIELSANFSKAPGNRGTETWLFAECMTSISRLRHWLKSAAGTSLEQVVREHLRNCKRLIEAGEILTTEGQPSGSRGISGKAKRALFRENLREPKPSAAVTGIPSEQRAAS
jgi:hypothetical protein